MTPDFAEWLLRSPDAERKGRVFNPLMPSGQRANAERSGRMVALLGKLSRVLVDAASGKTASAHDLRRSFGTRWSKKVMPPVLMRLMRHQNIATTMTFYVGLDCDEIADGLWQSSTVSVPFAQVEENGGGRDSAVKS
jgi:integrase